MSDTPEMISINVWLSGRSYRIRIQASEEEAVRRAAKIADQKVMEMRNHYAGKDDQDFLAMTLLSYAADTESDAFGGAMAQDQLQQLHEKLDAALRDK